MFGKKQSQKTGGNYGFKACATCTTEHDKTCAKIDEEFARQLELNRNDPQYAAKLARAKQLRL